MNRQEQIKQAAEKSSEHISDWVWNFAYRAHFIAGAEWADLTMIENACEWLRNNWRKYINIDADGVVCFGHWENDFRKAMKGD